MRTIGTRRTNSVPSMVSCTAPGGLGLDYESDGRTFRLLALDICLVPKLCWVSVCNKSRIKRVSLHEAARLIYLGICIHDDMSVDDTGTPRAGMLA